MIDHVRGGYSILHAFEKQVVGGMARVSKGLTSSKETAEGAGRSWLAHCEAPRPHQRGRHC